MKVYRSEKARKGIMDTYDKLLAMWDTEFIESGIPTLYGSTHVIQCGEPGNPPLVLFHGVGDDSALMWLYNAKELARHFMVYAIDTIGGPGKSVPNRNYDKGFDDARWIDEVLAGLKLEKVYLAGVSNGAYITQYYGLHRPERVLKMVCMAGTVPAGDYNPMKIMIKVFLPEALLPTKKNTYKLMRKMCGKNSGVFTENPVIMEHYRFLLKGFNNMSMSHHNLGNFNDGQIDAIRDKTLYLMGDADPFAIMGGKDALVKHKMKALFFPEVGHGLNHEIADAVNRIIVEYFTNQRGEECAWTLF